MNDIRWWVHFGDDVELPNICDKNCLACYDDYGTKTLEERPQDKRNELFKQKGFYLSLGILIQTSLKKSCQNF
jgi:hypothetical protein